MMTDDARPRGPLDGIRVLDLTRVLAGPYATQMLADMGADVIKVERPGVGDDTRHFGPPFVDGESAYFLSINRNKRSICLDLRSAPGQRACRRLADQADVLVENFRPGTLERLGLGSLGADNLGLIQVSISGFGATGPMRERPGYDLLVQGMGGNMSISGERDGSPTKSGASIGDLLAGIYAAHGAVLALYARTRTGRGQKVDVSMLDGQVSLLTYHAGIHFATGETPQRRGNGHPTIVPFRTFRASDGYINLAVGNDAIWKRCVAALGSPGSLVLPEYETNADRVRNRDKLEENVQVLLGEASVDHWLALFEAADVPCGPILTIPEVLAHPQVLARDMVTEVDHPGIGPLKQLGIPIHLSETPGSIDSPPPLLGQDTRAVLEESGLAGEDIEAIIARQA